MSKTNTTRYALLGVLRVAPFSGYDIKKFCDMSISNFWQENYGRIYPMLKQLEEEGMVTKRAQQTPGRPPKNVYKITEKGTDELTRWLTVPPEHHPMRLELLLKVFFAKDLPPENIIAKLKSEREEHQRQLQTYAGIETMLTTSEPQRSSPGLPYWLATLDFGKRFSRTMVEWCDDTIRAIENSNPPRAHAEK